MAEYNRATDDWRPRAYLLGGAIGLAIGLLAAHLYVRGAEESSQERPMLTAGDMLRIGLDVLSLVRRISEMASGGRGQAL